jgi:hypothetical protein
MAARVAAQLKKEPDVQIDLMKGGLGEFSVSIDGHKYIDTSRFWYSRPSRVLDKVRALLAE